MVMPRGRIPLDGQRSGEVEDIPQDPMLHASSAATGCRAARATRLATRRSLCAALLRSDGRRGRRAQEEIGADTPFVAMPVT
jgi:hypothetical protein